jgi:hypothetical protein
MRKWREAETQHGRVAMLAAVGMLVTEEPIEYHPLFEAYNKDIGPAIRHLDEVRAVEPLFFVALGGLIGALELNRAKTGFSAPEGEFEFQQVSASVIIHNALSICVSLCSYHVSLLHYSRLRMITIQVSAHMFIFFRLKINNLST